MPLPPGQPVLQWLVTLEDVRPAVWRRLLVPGSVRLDTAHRVLQAAMGWQDCHLHYFDVGGLRYGMQFDEFPEGELDEREVTVRRAIGEAERFLYEYDFGDRWRHEVVVEAMWRSPRGLKFAVCLDGQNACPPEDCGGPPGYAEVIEALSEPSHDDHDRLRDWLGAFDPRAFDLALANARLQTIR